MRRIPLFLVTVLSLISLLAAACSSADSGPLTIYSGRSEELIGPLLERFEEQTGLDVTVRYDESPNLAATLLEEGENSPADVFIAVDPASLGAVAQAGLFAEIPEAILDRVPARFSDAGGRWIGVSGRSRVIAYDPSRIDAADLPVTTDALAGPEWAGMVGIAPTNGSFQAFVAAMVLVDGEDATLDWLRAAKENGQPTYPRNSAIVSAIAAGEVVTGLVNHYYVLQQLAEDPDASVALHFLESGPGALVMPAGAGVLESSPRLDDAERLLEFLLSAESQRYFAEETFEYPLIGGVAPATELPSLGDLGQTDIALSDLATALDTATDLIAEAGLL